MPRNVASRPEMKPGKAHSNSGRRPKTSFQEADADEFLCAVAEESNDAAKADRMRSPYERRIRRPYFHAKPLGRGSIESVAGVLGLGGGQRR